MSRSSAREFQWPSSRRRRAVDRPKLSEDKKIEIKEAFDLFDTNKTGKIDYHELRVAMRALGFETKKQEIQKIRQEYDREDTGGIAYDDFEEIMTQKILQRDPDEEIYKAFQLFDDDQTGKISLKNLKLFYFFFFSHVLSFVSFPFCNLFFFN